MLFLCGVEYAILVVHSHYTDKNEAKEFIKIGACLLVSFKCVLYNNVT